MGLGRRWTATAHDAHRPETARSRLSGCTLRPILSLVTVKAEASRGRERALSFLAEQLELAASHDLISPARTVGAMADRLSYGVKEPRQARFIEFIRQAAERSVRQSEALLELARTAQAPCKTTVVSLDRLLDKARHGVTAAPHVAADVLGYVSAGELQLEKAISSILENAAVHAGPNSRVDVKVRRDGTRVRLAFEDDGPGIAAHLRERVFDIFDRLNAEAAGGRGTGLTLARLLVYRMDGNLYCDEPEGEGACFVVELPAGAR